LSSCTLAFRIFAVQPTLGGFRVAFEEACNENQIHSTCVFSSDIDAFCQESYEANFGERPHGDITKINETEIFDHDILFAGFPCQPFSIIGQMKGLIHTCFHVL